MSKEQPQGHLPYIDHLRIILLTGAINLAMAFLFHARGPITQNTFLWDAAICGFTTAVLDAVFTCPYLFKLRAAGQLPASVPTNRFLQRLPKNAAAFTLLLAVFFSAVMALTAYAVVLFFEIEAYTFPRFIVWKVVYSCVLSAKIVELLILRMVQPDCARPGDPPQKGDDPVKNPLPRKDALTHLFNTMTDDFGFNMLVGLLFGGTILVGDNVVILATARTGVMISGAILGVIVTLRMVYPTAAKLNADRKSGALPPLPEQCAAVAWLPLRPALSAAVLALPIMALSAVVLWAVLTFFGFEVLNFFQFFVVRTLYVTLLARLVVWLLVLRYRQPPSK